MFPLNLYCIPQCEKNWPLKNMDLRSKSICNFLFGFKMLHDDKMSASVLTVNVLP